MIGQHDAAGSHPDLFRAARDIADHHRGGGTGNAHHVVMLGHPVALVAQALHMPGEVARVPEGIGRRLSLGNRGQIKNR